MKNTDDMLTDAIRRTDAEIFAAAMDTEEPSDDADKSLEEMGDGLEGNTVEAEADETETDEGDESEAEGESEEGEGEEGTDTTGKTPAVEEEPKDAKGLRAALLAERKARQAAETRATSVESESRTQFAAMNDRLDKALQAMAGGKPKATAETDEGPDVFVDPEGFKNSIVNSVQQNYTLRRVAETFADAHEAHGKEFEAANTALGTLDKANPVDRATVQKIANAPNPGKALMKWHREQATLREVGTDPAAYRQRVRDELLKDPETRKAIVEALRAEAREGDGDGKPRTTTRLPKSLNSARGGGPARNANPKLYADNSDKAVFEYAMDD